jgi:hypothetical protein
MRRRGWLWSVAGVGFGLLLLAGTGGQGSAAPAGVLTPTVLWVPDEHHTGGAYTAIQAGPDGAVYLGTTFYDSYGRLLVLPPGQREWRLITDAGSATGDRTTGPYSQGKVHTKPVVAPDGRVYFGTKKSQARTKVAGVYRGGFLLVYDPRSGRVTNLGIPRPGQSIIALGLDAARQTLYILSDPEGHLVTYDLRSQRFTDRGMFTDGGEPSRYLPVLANGDAFHRAGADAVFRYDASAGRIERLPLRTTGQGSYEVPYAVIAHPDGRRFHGVGLRSGQVYTYLPGADHVTVRLHGALVPPGFSLPGVFYTMTGAPDGHVYYTGVFNPETLFLFRLNSRTERLELVGRVADLPSSPGRPFAPHVQRSDQLMVQGSTVAPDGTLYVMTAYPLRVLVFPRLAGGS